MPAHCTELLLLRAVLPPDLAPYAALFPPRLVHAVLTYPHCNVSAAELLSELAEYSPPELKR